MAEFDINIICITISSVSMIALISIWVAIFIKRSNDRRDVAIVDAVFNTLVSGGGDSEFQKYKLPKRLVKALLYRLFQTSQHISIPSSTVKTLFSNIDIQDILKDSYRVVEGTASIYVKRKSYAIIATVGGEVDQVRLRSLLLKEKSDLLQLTIAAALTRLNDLSVIPIVYRLSHKNNSRFRTLAAILLEQFGKQYIQFFQNIPYEESVTYAEYITKIAANRRSRSFVDKVVRLSRSKDESVSIIAKNTLSELVLGNAKPIRSTMERSRKLNKIGSETNGFYCFNRSKTSVKSPITTDKSKGVLDGIIDQSPGAEGKLDEKRGSKLQRSKFLVAFTKLLLPLVCSVLFILVWSIFARGSYVFNVVKYYGYFFMIVITIYYIFQLVLNYHSIEGIKISQSNWEDKSIGMLYRHNLLPSISVLAPAYNEQFNIVENVNYLLSVNYPDIEIIVVNDGSSDDSMSRMISSFNLYVADEREFIDRLDYKYIIKTSAIRAIYKSKEHPSIIVIDKDNGGKADALNCGINFAQGDYVCSVDVDSFVEPDALIKMASTILDSNLEVIAMGGLVLPQIDEDIKIPNMKGFRTLDRAQYLEYLRAFAVGRVAWDKLDSLMIISGAFGLFKTTRVREVGGYLTHRGVLNKSTVGEDMELVVRLKRYCKLIKSDYKIFFSTEAICHTEVPSLYPVLIGQRKRWQRGLIDVLYFHRDLIFKKGSKLDGNIMFPFYIVAEIYVPLINVIGIFILIAAVVFGIVDMLILTNMIVALMLSNMVLSSIPILLFNKHLIKYSARNMFRFIPAMIYDTFVLRFVVNWAQYLGIVDMIKGLDGWGKMVRRGTLDK